MDELIGVLQDLVSELRVRSQDARTVRMGDVYAAKAEAYEDCILRVRIAKRRMADLEPVWDLQP